MRKAFIFLGAILCAAIAAAAPKAELWERWSAHDDSFAETIRHDAWDSFLAEFVFARGGLNVVDYAAAQGARDKVGGYLRRLAEYKITSYSRAEQRAYWINLYNALTIDTILAHYPVAGIRDIDISPGLFADGPWGKKLISIEGEALSLDDIEHRILRPIWRDARIHYAVNCASVGCPNLANRAYTAANTEELLEQGARDYINDPRGARIDGGELFVSSIYKWFIADFGGDDAGVIQHLKQYAEPELRAALEKTSSIGGDNYDWSLNAK
jgi:hypothetical protein